VRQRVKPFCQKGGEGEQSPSGEKTKEKKKRRKSEEGKGKKKKQRSLRTILDTRERGKKRRRRRRVFFFFLSIFPRVVCRTRLKGEGRKRGWLVGGIPCREEKRGTQAEHLSLPECPSSLKKKKEKKKNCFRAGAACQEEEKDH